MTKITLTCPPTADKLSELKPIIDEIKSRGKCVVAVDGKCASGKSTIALSISSYFGARLIHTDDYFLPAEKRTADRLAEVGGNFDYERFYDEVIARLNEDEIRCGKFDCSKMAIGETVTLPHCDITIIEGSYSLHPYLGDYAGVKIFVLTEYETQLKRILLRNGSHRLAAFETKWIPMENRYFDGLNILDRCDFTVVT